MPTLRKGIKVFANLQQMNHRFKKTFHFLLISGNIFFLLLLIFSDLAPFVDPSKFWLFAIAGLLFPGLFLINFILFLAWLFVKPRNSLFIVVVLLLSIHNLTSTFAFNFKAGFIQEKRKGDLRILTWNVGLMNYSEPDSNIAKINNAVIFKKIRGSGADVVCLQEFFSAVIPGNYYNLMDSISTTLSYPYRYFSMDNPKFDKKFYSGTIIFSRFKIVDTDIIIYKKPFVGSVIRASVLMNNDTVNIVSTRLRSARFQGEDYQAIHQIEKVSKGALEGSKNIIGKLREAYSFRRSEADICQALLSKSSHPTLFTGDINDVPVSYTYTKLKTSMSDGWLAAGSGLGGTFKFISPTLRIDQIFFDDKFTIRQISRVLSEKESDHNGIVADFTLKP